MQRIGTDRVTTGTRDGARGRGIGQLAVQISARIVGCAFTTGVVATLHCAADKLKVAKSVFSSEGKKREVCTRFRERLDIWIPGSEDFIPPSL